MTEELLLVGRKHRLAQSMRQIRWRAVGFISVATLLGALGGLLWATIVPLPSYTLLENHSAWISERAQASVVGVDVYFTAIVGGLGLLCGFLGWIWFQRSSWLVIAVPLIAACLAALVCWQVGLLAGPSGLADRIAAASVGDVVSVDLTLRSPVALLVAPFTAITPIMLLAAFWPEGRARKSEPKPDPT